MNGLFSARRMLLVTCVGLVAIAIGAVGVATAQPTQLQFVEPDELELTYDEDGKSKDASVWLENPGPTRVMPNFEAILEDDGAAVRSPVVLAGIKRPRSAARSLGPGEIGRYRLHMTDAAEATGRLVAQADGVGPASLKLSLAAERTATRGVNQALWIPLLAAFVVLVACWYWGRGGVGFFDKLGSATELDFSKSFASTLTAVGVLLGTIIAATDILPEDTEHFSKAGFVGLNLIFGVTIAIAAAISASLMHSEPYADSDGKVKWKVGGYVATFMVAALLTLWAVFGELWTMWFLIAELGVERGVTGLGVDVMRVLLAVAALAMLPYSAVKVKLAVQSPKPVEPKVAKRPPGREEERARERAVRPRREAQRAPAEVLATAEAEPVLSPEPESAVEPVGVEPPEPPVALL